MPCRERHGGWLRGALALLVLALSAAAPGQDRDAPQREAEDAAAEAQRSEDSSQRQEDAADAAFRPSERIDADTAVRFPADI